jgi:hypothetical protein
MDVCVRLFYVSVFFYVGSGLATGWSYRLCKKITKLKKRWKVQQRALTDGWVDGWTLKRKSGWPIIPVSVYICLVYNTRCKYRAHFSQLSCDARTLIFLIVFHELPVGSKIINYICSSLEHSWKRGWLRDEVLRSLTNEPFEITAYGNTCVNICDSWIRVRPKGAQCKAINLVRPWENVTSAVFQMELGMNPTRTKVPSFFTE